MLGQERVRSQGKYSPLLRAGMKSRGNRRFTRLTNAFSKKLENLQAAVAVHFAHYNFVRKHQTLKTTPAVAAGVEARQWDLEELVRMAG